MFSRLFHQYSWNSEVETAWKSWICWRHRTSNNHYIFSFSQSMKMFLLLWQKLKWQKISIFKRKNVLPFQGTNSIKTASGNCILCTGRSENWFWLNLPTQMAKKNHICKWQNVFTFADGYLLPFLLL